MASLAGIAVDQAVLADADTIDRVIAEEGAAARSHKDIPKREAELADARSAIGLLLTELSSVHTPEQASAEIRSAADIAEAPRPGRQGRRPGRKPDWPPPVLPSATGRSRRRQRMNSPPCHLPTRPMPSARRWKKRRHSAIRPVWQTQQPSWP